MRNIDKLIMCIVFFGIAIESSARWLCMCCDKKAQLLEFKVKACQEILVNTKNYSVENEVIVHDLKITAVVRASVDMLNGAIEFDTHQKNLNLHKVFIYEDRDGKTCKDFGGENIYTMESRKYDCTPAPDMGVDHSTDNVCKHGGFTISKLNFQLRNILEK